MNINNNAALSLHKLADSDMTESEFLRSVENNLIPMQQFFTYYKCAIMEIETKFRVLNEQFSINGESNPIEFIQSRIKSYGSIYHKVISKNIPRNLEAIAHNVSDIAGIRVVCSFVQDIYRLADCFLQQDDIFLIEKKDYIENPKSNGYRSLHLIVEVPIFLENEKRLVKAEVQLRTIAMDFWASLEHKLKYKTDNEVAEDLRYRLKICAKAIQELDTEMQNINNAIQDRNS
jgi:putative GTP pyrophosphokinase